MDAEEEAKFIRFREVAYPGKTKRRRKIRYSSADVCGILQRSANRRRGSIGRCLRWRLKGRHKMTSVRGVRQLRNKLSIRARNKYDEILRSYSSEMIQRDFRQFVIQHIAAIAPELLIEAVVRAEAEIERQDG